MEIESSEVLGLFPVCWCLLTLYKIRETSKGFSSLFTFEYPHVVSREKIRINKNFAFIICIKLVDAGKNMLIFDKLKKLRTIIVHKSSQVIITY